MFHWYKITYELQHVQFLLSSTCENFFTNLLYSIRKKFSKQNQFMQSEGYPKTYLLPNNEKIQSKVNRQSSLK